MLITFKHKGDFSKTTRYFNRAREVVRRGILDKYGKAGVAALSSATPVDTGVTAQSWSYKIENTSGSSKLTFYNSNVENGIIIAIILQYGHGTGTGGWVEGRDYINPAVQPVFDQIVNDLWGEVTRL